MIQTTFETIEAARLIRDMRNSAMVRPALRESLVIVCNERDQFILVTLGFASKYELEIVK